MIILANSVYREHCRVPTKPVNVKQVLVYLTPQQHDALLKLKEKLGVPVSESIRRAIDRYLKKVEFRK